MYYTLTLQPIDKNSPTYTGDYIKYVESLRAKFTVRIEIRSPDRDLIVCSEMEKNLQKYLKGILPDNTWCMQQPTGFVGLYYFWFMYREDAVAFALKFNGKVI